MWRRFIPSRLRRHATLVYFEDPKHEYVKIGLVRKIQAAGREKSGPAEFQCACREIVEATWLHMEGVEKSMVTNRVPVTQRITVLSKWTHWLNALVTAETEAYVEDKLSDIAKDQSVDRAEAAKRFIRDLIHHDIISRDDLPTWLKRFDDQLRAGKTTPHLVERETQSREL